MVSSCSSPSSAAVRLRSAASSSTINTARRFCCAWPLSGSSPEGSLRSREEGSTHRAATSPQPTRKGQRNFIDRVLSKPASRGTRPRAKPEDAQ
jgi:hypothetical protein